MKILFVIPLAFLSVTCNRSNTEDVLAKPKMVNVLWDIMEVDEFANEYLAKDSSKDMNQERIKLYRQVFQIHKISEKDFSSSFKYYSGRPDILKVIYDSLAARGERERKNIYRFKGRPTK